MEISDYQLILHHLECSLAHAKRSADLDPDLSSTHSSVPKVLELLREEIEYVTNLLIYKQAGRRLQNSVEEILKTVQ